MEGTGQLGTMSHKKWEKIEEEPWEDRQMVGLDCQTTHMKWEHLRKKNEIKCREAHHSWYLSVRPSVCLYNISYKLPAPDLIELGPVALKMKYVYM
jgi:hypothetical protein